jgi:hypothetical protein
MQGSFWRRSSLEVQRWPSRARNGARTSRQPEDERAHQAGQNHQNHEELDFHCRLRPSRRRTRITVPKRYSRNRRERSALDKTGGCHE